MATDSENDDHFIIDYAEQYWPEYPISQQQLDHPTSDFVFGFYERFQDTVQVLLFRMMGNRSVDTSVKLKTDCDPVYPLLHCINRYLRTVSDQADCVATLADLYEPTAKRTKIRFKLLLNLLVFYENQVDNIHSIVVKRMGAAEECREKKLEMEQLRVELAGGAEALARSEDELLKLQRELTAIELNYLKLQEQKVDWDRSCKKSQHELKTLVDTFTTKNTLITNIKANIQGLREQIVTEESYKSLRDLRDNFVLKCEALQTKAALTSENLESRTPTLESYEGIVKLIDKLILLCEELKVCQNDILRANTLKKGRELQCKEKTKELENYAEDKSKYINMIQANKELKHANILKFNDSMKKIQQEMKEIEIAQNKEKVIQNGIANEKSVLQEETATLRNHCQKTKLEIQELNVLYENTYTRIINAENKVANYCNTVLGDIVEVLSGVKYQGEIV